jgi:2-dehydro-3-deoxyphosphogluconate aldolase / (4S)-4-hydroxy-2-oxoglutarate aldolase
MAPMTERSLEVELGKREHAGADRNRVRATIAEVGILPALKTTSVDEAVFAAEALAEAGVPIVEIAVNFADAAAVISKLAARLPKVLVGAGNVMTAADALACVDAGARFVATAAVLPEMNEVASKTGVAVIAGALTPTEIVAAWNGGADLVKVFPCDAAGGAPYIRSVRTALPNVPLLAAGGVTQQTAFGLIAAGATAIGIGQALIPAEALHRRQARQIQELARRFASHVDNGRIEAAGGNAAAAGK